MRLGAGNFPLDTMSNPCPIITSTPTCGHIPCVVTGDSNAVTTVQDIFPLPDKLVLGVLRVLRNEGEYKFHFLLCLMDSFVGSVGFVISQAIK
ncbi:MAG: hypothetical protein K2P73_21355 [Lachnospiraceae bacterium]|nr:hypothetical protein [Lachnospiraceae bacterium]